MRQNDILRTSLYWNNFVTTHGQSYLHALSPRSQLCSHLFPAEFSTLDKHHSDTAYAWEVSWENPSVLIACLPISNFSVLVIVVLSTLPFSISATREDNNDGLLVHPVIIFGLASLAYWEYWRAGLSLITLDKRVGTARVWRHGIWFYYKW